LHYVAGRTSSEIYEKSKAFVLSLQDANFYSPGHEMNETWSRWYDVYNCM